MQVIVFDERRVRGFRTLATYHVMVRSGVNSSSNPSIDSVLLIGARFLEAVEWAAGRVTDDDSDALVFLLEHDDQQDVTTQGDLNSTELFRVPPLSASDGIEGYRMDAFPMEY